jgi:hypothetical protein
MDRKVTINTLLTILFVLSALFTAKAQEKEKVKHLPSIMLGVSGQKYMGYVGSHTNVNPLLDTRLGYFLSVEQRFGKVFGVELVGSYGKLAGTDNQTFTSAGVVTQQYYANMQAQVMQGQLMVVANFDGIMKSDPAVSPFIKAGIGYMMFNTYSDLQDATGANYIYQTDGSIVALHSVTVNSVTTTSLVPTKRDYTYETKLPTNGQSGSLVVPLMLGLDFNFGKHMSSMIGVGYTMCLSNWIDGSGQGSAAFISANVGLRYEFGKKTEGGPEDKYKDVDFSSIDHLDADKDGVPDDKDMCHGTPKGVKVDEKGCPLDSDNDGVPDYLDKEPTTAKGNKVDGFGVTIDEKALAQHQKDWENEAPERSKEFNVKPSAEYLKKVEAAAIKANKGKFNANKIPAELKSADINGDGYISADEITKTIDSFFEGSGDFTVEKINKLIDFFFEQ